MSDIWPRSISLYLNVDAYGSTALLAGPTSSSPRNDTPAFIQGDLLRVCLYFRRPSSLGGASTVAELPAGTTVALLAKELPLAASSPLLYLATSFEAEGSDDTLTYVSTIDLNTLAGNTALGDDSQINLRFDVELRDTADRATTLYFDAILRRRVYEGELTPVSTVNANIRQRADGKIDFYDYGLDTWMEPVLENGVLQWVEAP